MKRSPVLLLAALLLAAALWLSVRPVPAPMEADGVKVFIPWEARGFVVGFLPGLPQRGQAWQHQSHKGPSGRLHTRRKLAGEFRRFGPFVWVDIPGPRE